MQIGVDLGGTKIEAAALDSDGAVIVRRRVPTPRRDYNATISAITALVQQLEQETGRRGSIGVGIPGALSATTGLIKNANSTWLLNQTLDRDLAAAFGRPVRLMNDANCLALSEAADGAAAGADVVFAAILGTGTGGGIVVHGRPLIGCNAIAGEWGHNPLPWRSAAELPGPDCYCGKQGCIETFLSGPGMADDFRRAGGPDIAAPELTAKEIVERAQQGEPEALAAVTRYEDRLARALAQVINILDPDAVVLGGGLSNVDRFYETVPALLPRYVFSDNIATRLLKARHGDSSGVFGAARLWRPEELPAALAEAS
ncbi:ROK family protein [uncultured Nitratireductor sp.]|uniref:ROK family protein n=1 Tax=uncultured Nitratireductor sp. TaxID=520953 RepID=UPI0025E2BE7F|nr:ROK family protein [uncultured Nitratireductor sp.]